MRIAVIEYRKNPPKTALELIEAIERKGHVPVYIKAHMLDAVIKDNTVRVFYGANPVDVDAALLRNIGLYLSLDVFLKRMGVLEALASLIPVVNHPSAVVVARDKWKCLLRLSLAGLPVPETLITENPFSAMRFTQGKRKVVYKPIMGSLGLGSSLITDPDISFHTTRSLKNIGIPSLYQEFLEKPGYDFRVFVVGDRIIGAMKRVSTFWKTNIAQGASGVKVTEEEEPEVFKLAYRAVKVIGLDYAGVDIAYDTRTDKYYILELNAFPHWEGLRASTGVNPPDYIVDYIIEKARK